MLTSRTIVYTPYVNITARRLDLELDLHTGLLSSDINRVLDPECHPDIDLEVDIENRTELVIIDEADRLKTTAWNSSATSSTAATWV